MTGKYTLIVDGNFFLHKTYFIGQKIKSNGAFNFIDEPEADKNLLLWKLSIDFASEIKRFEGILNQVVYCIDSSSWRKTYLDTQYKANRTKSESINWSAIYDVHTEFSKTLESLGVIVSRVYGAEADDLIFAWSSYLNQNGKNAIILSGDNDLLQLVHQDKSSGANTIYYNKFNKDMHVFPGFSDWLSVEDHANTTNDIFNMPVNLMSNVKQNLRGILKSNKMKSHEVNVNEFIFRKILIGDSGDNVPPLDTKIKEGPKGPITYRVTDTMANKILNLFIKDKIFVKQIHFFEDSYIEEICKFAKTIIKIDDDIEKIKRNWIRNRDLVFLHASCIPEKIIQSMFNNIDSSKFKALSADGFHSLMSKDKILEKTSWTSERKTEFNESNLFKTIEVSSTKQVKETTIIKENTSSFDSNFWESLLK